MTATLSDLDLRSAYAGGVYFFSPEKSLSHNSGCLMEGLLDLGIKVRANTDVITSREVSRPLLGVDLPALVSQPFAGLSAFIVDITHNNAYVPLDSLKGGRLAYLTNSDLSLFCDVPAPFPLFAVHDSAIASKGGKRFPLAFGPSKGLMTTTEARTPFEKRKRAALKNFRPTFSQSVRGLLELAYVPHLRNAMELDETTYAPKDYVHALMNTQVCLAYGGDFYNSLRANIWLAERDPAAYRYHSFEKFEGATVIMRWDSWRFWESLLAGCLTVHLDFAKYGFKLPVAPQPWVHYAPIDLDDLKGSVAALLDHEKQWPEIAAAGRAWAIEHYAPAITAKRVLSQMI